MADTGKNAPKTKVMIVDDEQGIIFTLKNLLEEYEIVDFTDATKAMKSLDAGDLYDILVIDFRLQAFSGLDILVAAQKNLKKPYRAILLTAFSNKELLERVINDKLVYKVINKPIFEEELKIIIDESAENLRREVEQKRYTADLRETLDAIIVSSCTNSGDQILVYKSKQMKDLYNLALKYAYSNANLIITGENGVGKEVFANLIHSNSKRTGKPFIKVNCSAIPEALFESDLFGYEKGAYTGAVNSKPGKFKLANGGSIFLDEIGDLPLALQPKLLRVIETKEFTPLGSNEILSSDVRIIAATNIDLKDKVANGEFREDLFFRLNVLNIHVPALRDRREDIALLASLFLESVSIHEGGPLKEFHKEAIEFISGFDFHGNVRELKNLIYRLYLSVENNEIGIDAVKRACTYQVQKTNGVFDEPMELSKFIDKVTKQFIERQLQKNDSNVAKTAQKLGMQKSNLYRKMRELSILAQN